LTVKVSFRNGIIESEEGVTDYLILFK